MDLDDLLKTIIKGFTATITPPLDTLTLSNEQGVTNAPPPVPPPPPPPPPRTPPPGGSPLADNNLMADGQPAETPNSSDQATSDMAASLDGSSGGEGPPIIPGILNGAPPPSPPQLDASTLPGSGNSALWQ